MLKILDRFTFVGDALQAIQGVLNFGGWDDFPQFASKQGHGRVGLIGCLLGFFLGVYSIVFTILTCHKLDCVSLTLLVDTIGPARIELLWQWCAYFISLCVFHLLEFLTTAIYNADIASADAYLVNHSTTYTFAVLFSWIEFGTRLLFFPNFNNTTLSLVGIAVVAIAQTIRSLAMITCGESFNHVIQNRRKDNHVLIKHGIYGILRHPSYFGFYYWSIGMQLILNNMVAGCLSAIASSIFFRRRIPYEEESLVCHFEEEYLAYAKQTYIGIPLVPTKTVTSVEHMNTKDE